MMLVQGRQVVHVLQAFARRFQKDGELLLAPRGLQQLAGLEALLPQRGALSRRGGRHEQGARGAFAEPRREQRRGVHAVAHDAVQLVRVEHEQLRRPAGASAVWGMRRTMPSSAADAWGSKPCRRIDAVGHRHGPRLVDAAAVGRMQHDAPVARLVLAAFHHQRPVVGHGAGRRTLLAHERHQVALRVVVQPICCKALAEGGVDLPSVPAASGASSAMPAATARTNAPRARPVSAGRPTPSPCQNGRRALLPGAGSTITRSRVISRMRHVLVPSAMMSPTRDSYTISSSSSPTRRRPTAASPSGSTTENMPRSGMVPAATTARRCAPGRADSLPASRSHTMRGLKSERSAEAWRPASMSSTA